MTVITESIVQYHNMETRTRRYECSRLHYEIEHLAPNVFRSFMEYFDISVKKLDFQSTMHETKHYEMSNSPSIILENNFPTLQETVLREIFLTWILIAASGDGIKVRNRGTLLLLKWPQSLNGKFN